MNRAQFYKTVRSRLGALNQSQVDGFEAVLNVTAGAPLSYQAYMLATAWHETGATMKPISEFGGNAYFTRMYDVAGDRPKLCISMGNTCAGDGPRYHGRGYVQLTWKTNYERADRECAEAGLIDAGAIMADPELTKRPDVAAHIMRKGMEEGWFTGKKLSSYLPPNGVATRDQYINARRIINGTDRADTVEDYAQIFERALRNGGLS